MANDPLFINIIKSSRSRSNASARNLKQRYLG
ncbi:hypothetical protein COLO4_21716 [Corchorus olitorius]|uniref:Uncharacterized protein n=1 Tax=Corchorus olitorius TaxID=93759 RepID=A0A1R3IRG1_9ROSI|nr:hypothetical protein COLO4_21716 [Corchorus olitorius]